MTLLDMSLAGGAIILAGALIRTLGRDRLPRWTFEALWALAMLRLTTPVALPFRWSVWTWLSRETGAVPAAASKTVSNAAAPAMAAGGTLSVDIIQGLSPAGACPVLSARTAVWLAGAALCGAVFALSYARCLRAYRAARPVEDECVTRWLAEHPLRRAVRVRVSAAVKAPLTYGVLRPVILLPETGAGQDPETRGFVLTHELAHIRRLDALRKLALAAVICLHWFNPAVWLMLALANRDMELACDEAVVRALGPETRRGYAHALLDMEQIRSGLTGLASGFSKNAIEERIYFIMKIRKKSFLSAVPALVLVLGVGAAFATAAAEPPSLAEAEVLVNAQTGEHYITDSDGWTAVMTEDEFNKTYGVPDVEWWTAEEYAAWLEQEKQELQDCLGTRAWTNTDGWFTWTQEKIDETIAMYEQTLRDIQDGLLVSRTVDGSADTVLAQGAGEHEEPLDDYWQSVRDEERQMEEEALAERVSQWEDALAPYAAFGLTYAYDAGTDEVLLFWNGERIRGIYDGTAGVWITGHAGDGTWPADTPELIAVYEDGELAGLREATAEEEAEWDELRRESAAVSAMTDHLSALMLGDDSVPEYILADYTDFRGRLEPYEKVYFDLGYVTADVTITAAVQADKDTGCHVSICPAGEGPGDYLTTVRPEEAVSHTVAEPVTYFSTASSDIRPGNYAVCVWSSANEPIEFALCYKVN